MTRKDWTNKMELSSVWDYFNIDFTHHHINFDSVSIIDHFLVSPDLLPLIIDAGVSHQDEEHSRHDPIWMTIDIGNLKQKVVKRDKNKREPG